MEFHKLQDALAKIKLGRTSDKIFSQQLSVDGSRKFLLINEVDLEYLLRWSPKHFYEVLLEGRPTKLYFDLDCDISLNPDADCDTMLLILVKKLKAKVLTDVGVLIEDNHVLVLDSSNSSKISLHVIVDHEIFIAPDNLAIGYFVKSLIEELSPSELISLSVEAGGGRKLLFIDKNVYSRNQNFRIYASTKFAKISPLRLYRSDLFNRRYFDADNCPIQEDMEQNILLATLIQNSKLKAMEHWPYKKMIADKKEISGPSVVADIVAHPVFLGFLNTLYGVTEFKIVRTYPEVSMIQGLPRPECPVVERVHKSNNTYIVFNKTSRTVKLECSKLDCKEANLPANEFLVPLNLEINSL